jgi:hypothetical protein
MKLIGKGGLRMKDKLVNILEKNEGKELCYHMSSNSFELGTENLGEMSFLDTPEIIKIDFESCEITLPINQILDVEDENEHKEGNPESLFTVYLKDNTTLHFYESE